MKIEPSNLTKVIEQNFSHIMPDFYEMQTECLTSWNFIYDDLDTSLVAMVLINRLYKNTVKKNSSTDKISFKNFNNKDNEGLPISTLRIKDISNILNLPRETVRRKKKKLIEKKIFFLDKKKQLYSLNTNIIDKKVLNLQIYNLNKFLAKFSIYLNYKNINHKEINHDVFKKDIDKKFLIYITNYLDFQISYFSKLKTYMDMETSFITLLCALNTTSHIKRNNESSNKNFNSKSIFNGINYKNNFCGLSATSISEITKIPRTTVIRKLVTAEKLGFLKKDKFKRYAHDQNNKEVIYPFSQFTMKILGSFFSQCLEIYSTEL